MWRMWLKTWECKWQRNEGMTKSLSERRGFKTCAGLNQSSSCDLFLIVFNVSTWKHTGTMKTLHQWAPGIHRRQLQRQSLNTDDLNVGIWRWNENHWRFWSWCRIIIITGSCLDSFQLHFSWSIWMLLLGLKALYEAKQHNKVHQCEFWS